MRESSVTLFIFVWLYVGMYYLFKIWFEPSVFVLAIGVSMAVVFTEIIDYVNQDKGVIKK